MKTQDPIEIDSKLIIDMYDYALTHNLDITNKDDVKTILMSLGQKDVDQDRVERLMTALAVTDNRIKRDINKRKKKIN